ncbi:hypothetical protein AAEH84_17510, partial [Shewanella indica]|uniref:hypothetical protein n=1 Tax=Shewanella indica TaxID=768528 RepID=UPI00313EEC8B
PDLNRRPSGYEPDELPCCSIPRPICTNQFEFIIKEFAYAAGYEPTTFEALNRELSPASYHAVPSGVLQSGVDYSDQGAAMQGQIIKMPLSVQI